MQNKSFTIIFSILTLLWLVLITTMPFFLQPLLLSTHFQENLTLQQINALRIHGTLPLIAPFFAGMNFFAGTIQIIFLFFALLSYLIMGKKGAYMLKFYWIMTFIEAVIKCLCLFIIPIHFVWLNGAENIDASTKELLVFNQKIVVLFLFIWAVLSIPIIRFLEKGTNISKTLNEENEQIPFEANSLARFLNWFLDMLFFTPFFVYFYLFLNKNYDYSGKDFDFTTFLCSYVFIKMLYYIVSEVIFDISPAKIFTHTSVYNLDGEKATITQKLLRTILRFIPFEPLTWFLLDKKIGHDEWSDTIICKKINTHDKY